MISNTVLKKCTTAPEPLHPDPHINSKGFSSGKDQTRIEGIQLLGAFRAIQNLPGDSKKWMIGGISPMQGGSPAQWSGIHHHMCEKIWVAGLPR